MVFAVARIGDILVPPDVFRVYAVIGKRVAPDNFPARKRARFEPAVLYFVLRRAVGILGVVAGFDEERALGLRLGILSDPYVVHA